MTRTSTVDRRAPAHRAQRLDHALAGSRARRRSAGRAGSARAGRTAPYYARVTLRNGEIADLFDLLGDLYELDGANIFRVLAYHRAATRMRELPRVGRGTLSEEGRLQELPGIGATIAAKVDELRDDRARWPRSRSCGPSVPGVAGRDQAAAGRRHEDDPAAVRRARRHARWPTWEAAAATAGCAT